MFRLLLLLISFLAITAHADELETSYSGYATYTYIGQKTWLANDNQIALNLNAQYGPYAVKTQLSTRESLVKRLAAEYAVTKFGETLVFQVGRVPRVATLMSDVFGNPDEWGISVLPLSMYNPRKAHSATFNAIDGVKAMWDHNYSRGNLRLGIDWGTGAVDDKQNLQMELTRKPYNPGWDMHSRTNDDYTWFGELTFDNWTALLSSSKYTWDTSLNNPLDRTSVATTRAIKDIDYNFSRFGIKYATTDWALQAEHGISRLNFNGVLNSRARDSYVMGTYYVSDDVAVFGGYSEGYKRGNPYTARDRFAGVVYRFGKWSTIIEYHNGENSWQRYNSTDYTWNSIAASLTYRF